MVYGMYLNAVSIRKNDVYQRAPQTLADMQISDAAVER